MCFKSFEKEFLMSYKQFHDMVNFYSETFYFREELHSGTSELNLTKHYLLINNVRKVQ